MQTVASVKVESKQKLHRYFWRV